MAETAGTAGAAAPDRAGGGARDGVRYRGRVRCRGGGGRWPGIGGLLPGTVVVVEAYGDEGTDAPLYLGEAAVMARAVDKRRREFTAVRSCARRAMEKLGVPPQPVLPGKRGAPGWPDGLAGSMTHCAG